MTLPGTLPTSVENRLTLYSAGSGCTAEPKVCPAQETLPLLPTRRVSSASRSVPSASTPQRMPNMSR